MPVNFNTAEKTLIREVKQLAGRIHTTAEAANLNPNILKRYENYVLKATDSANLSGGFTKFANASGMNHTLVADDTRILGELSANKNDNVFNKILGDIKKKWTVSNTGAPKPGGINHTQAPKFTAPDEAYNYISEHFSKMADADKIPLQNQAFKPMTDYYASPNAISTMKNEFMANADRANLVQQHFLVNRALELVDVQKLRSKVFVTNSIGSVTEVNRKKLNSLMKQYKKFLSKTLGLKGKDIEKRLNLEGLSKKQLKGMRAADIAQRLDRYGVIERANLKEIQRLENAQIAMSDNLQQDLSTAYRLHYTNSQNLGREYHQALAKARNELNSPEYKNWTTTYALDGQHNASNINVVAGPKFAQELATSMTFKDAKAAQAMAYLAKEQPARVFDIVGKEFGAYEYQTFTQPGYVSSSWSRFSPNTARS